MASPQDIYYYRLYHLVAHWAVFGATLALLITTGLMASSQEIKHLWFFRSAIVITAFGSCVVLWRMNTFGSLVNQYIGAAAETTRGPLGSWNLIFLGVAVVGLAVLDWLALRR